MQIASVGRSVVGVNDTAEISCSLEFWGPPGGRLNLRTGSASVIGGVPLVDAALAVAPLGCHNGALLPSLEIVGTPGGGTSGGVKMRGLMTAGVTIGVDNADTEVA